MKFGIRSVGGPESKRLSKRDQKGDRKRTKNTKRRYEKRNYFASGKADVWISHVIVDKE